MNAKKQSLAAFLYLAFVPLIAAGIGFGIGGAPNIITVPIWIAHALLMIFLFRKIETVFAVQQGYLFASIFLFMPWVIFTIFAGFGPPPSTPEGWTDAALQQQIRYSLLSVGGIAITIGFRFLAENLKETDGKHQFQIAMTLLYIAMPLYIANMLYWGFYLTESFRLFTEEHITTRPAWYLSMRELFIAISSMALCLLYVSSAVFALALRKSGVFTRKSTTVYIAFSIFGFAGSLIPPNAPNPLDVIGFLVAVPAISFIIPYLMGLNLIRVSKRNSDN